MVALNTWSCPSDSNCPFPIYVIFTLTKKGNNARNWTPQAEEAFLQIKNAFASASILHRSDLSKPFFLEIDAYFAGVGVVLSQKKNMGRILTSVMCFYMNHKNLLYLKTAHCLNRCQARLSLFFSKFWFPASFPASWQYCKGGCPALWSPRSSLWATVHHWSWLSHTSCTCTSTRNSSWEDFCLTVLEANSFLGTHSSNLDGNSAILKTVELISYHYWWPFFHFIAAFSLCT